MEFVGLRQDEPADGSARARDLANRVSLSEDTIRRMVAYFERHEVDKQGESWDEQGKGWQAWNGWGGDEGWSWSKRKIAEFDAMSKENDKPVQNSSSTSTTTLLYSTLLCDALSQLHHSTLR